MKKIFFASVFILSIFSCGDTRQQNKPIVENAIDNAESSVSGSFESYRGDNLIDKTYSELIKNDKKLKALDEKIFNSQQESRKVINAYEEIISKSESFYREAENAAKSITDSLTKNQIEKDIQSSKDQYSLKISGINMLITRINQNNADMNSLYTAFKIRKTLPEIEKYQKAHPLKTDSLDQFINKQNQLLEELKKLK
ncbi:hypothetical protein SAMN05421786_101994 [Chryseobacterium ureilyticum]|uniref:Cell-wall binding lipoprotein n=1 Tax=Chryseobacterium ureilyticum TaxID=373668 RepID=A0A1N7L434_9FLAO|nr:hypothetical protein [Chryseobacterium ureilyticum]SIS68567.1 hypothetical protein SAMN05421786_101994 [Chryseobacterium ureilyticum]